MKEEKEEEKNSKQKELAQDKIKRVGNSSFKRKNAVLNNFNGHLFKYISDHE